MKTPTKDRTCTEVQHSSSKAPRPGASEKRTPNSNTGVSPGGSDFKSPGVHAKDLNKSPGVQSKESNKPGSSEFKSPGVMGTCRGKYPTTRAPAGVMGTCRGMYPPKSKARRQAFEKTRVQQQQQQHQQQQQKLKRKRAATKANKTKARSRWAQHIGWAMRQFRADHPRGSPAAAMAYAQASYNKELQQEGLESKRVKGEKMRILRRAAKQEKEALWQAGAEQREQRAAEVKKDRMERLAEALRRKQEATKAEAKELI